MDDRSQPSDTNKQFGENAAQREPVQAPRQVLATDAASRDARATEPAVGTDGQLVEAGYGHGV